MGELELLRAATAPTTANDAERTVEAVFYSGSPVERIEPVTGEKYMLSFDPDGADLSLLNQGAPVLDSHKLDGVGSQIGVVERAWRDGKRFLARLRFSKRPELEGLWRDIRDGIVNHFSMGVELLKVEAQRDSAGRLAGKLAKLWRPLEISLAAIPADFGTETLRAAQTSSGKGRDVENTNNQAAAEQAVCPAAEIERLAKGFGLEHDRSFLEGLIAAGATREVALEALNRRAVERYERTPTHSRAAIVYDERDRLREAMAEGLYCRLSGKQPGEPAREYVSLRIPELARRYCELRGLRNWGGSDYLKLAAEHSTSDFPSIVGAAANKVLLDAYQAAQSGIIRLARRAVVSDFKTQTRIRIGEFPELVQVPEAAEIQSGTTQESKETYRAYSYARKIGFSRELLVNDDLGAINSMISNFGLAAADLEAQLLVDLLYGTAGAGPTLGDGIALFHATRGNLAGSGAAISETTLDAARVAMRKVTALDGKRIIAAEPAFLLVPPEAETSGQKIIAQLYAATVNDVNPFSGTLTLLVEPRLSAKSTTGWYLFADPQALPILELGVLGDGQQPRIETQDGWSVLGIEARAIHEIGVGVIGWRGSFRNPGA